MEADTIVAHNKKHNVFVTKIRKGQVIELETIDGIIRIGISNSNPNPMSSIFIRSDKKLKATLSEDTSKWATESKHPQNS